MLVKSELDQLAFGVVPALRRYELYYARFQQLLPTFIELTATRGPNLSVLDIGSGMGDAKRFVDTVAPAAEWTGVEINPQRIEACQRLGYRRMITDVDLEQAALPVPDQSYDVVIASHVLEHLANAPQALADWYRVVKPGGSLLIGVPMHLPLVAGLATLRFRLRGRRPRAHCHFFSMRTLRRMLRGYPVRKLWGFRIFSARRQLPLEDYEWFFRASLWLGERLPGFTTEVNVDLRRPG